MATPFGSTTGPIYCLGVITVAVAGTPVDLSANVPITDHTGTAANPSPLKCVEIIVQADPANVATKSIYLIFKGQAAAAGSGTSIILQVPPGQERRISAKNAQALLSVDRMQLDTDSGGSKAIVTLVMT